MHPESLKVDTIIAVAQSSGSKILTELESKRLLGAYGIPSDDNLGSYCRGSCSRRRWSWISGGSQDQLGDNYSQDERRKSQVEIHSAEQVHAAAQYAPLLPLDQQQHVQHAVLSIRSVEERRLFHV